MRKCPIVMCKQNVDGLCLSPYSSCPNYALYREKTGKCETCDVKMDQHPKCEACGILCGTGHLDELQPPYRGHVLCTHCIAYWKGLDRILGRTAPWEEFLSPKPRRWKHYGSIR